MSPNDHRRYAQVTFSDYIKLPFIVCTLPFIISWKLITSPFSRYDRVKSWRRVVLDSALRFMASLASIEQFQQLYKPSKTTYLTWAKSNNMPVTIEELGDGARLLWIGPKRTDRVILYLHSGAYVLALPDYALDFWKHIQDKFRSENIEVGIVALEYTLVPEGFFPTQLHQSVLAVQHLLNAGIKPGSIHLAGDSAGGNLILGILSHICHPLPSIPKLELSGPLQGIYMMSPWVYLLDRTGTKMKNSKSDSCATALLQWGEPFLQHVPDSGLPYVEVLTAPVDWLSKISTLTRRILISTGENETLRGEDEDLYERLRLHHHVVQLEIDSNGVHIDPMFHFVVKDKREHPMVPKIMNWFREGLKPKDAA